MLLGSASLCVNKNLGFLNCTPLTSLPQVKGYSEGSRERKYRAIGYSLGLGGKESPWPCILLHKLCPTEISGGNPQT